MSTHAQEHSKFIKNMQREVGQTLAIGEQGNLSGNFWVLGVGSAQ